MIIEIEIPRQALLIHFGKTNYRRLFVNRPKAIKGVEILTIKNFLKKPKLLAIHFIRWNFNLPFTEKDEAELSKIFREAHISATVIEIRLPRSEIYQETKEIEIYPGLYLIISEIKFDEKLKDKPVLLGMKISKKNLMIDWHDTKIDIVFGIDNLKDVSVTLFCMNKNHQINYNN